MKIKLSFSILLAILIPLTLHVLAARPIGTSSLGIVPFDDTQPATQPATQPPAPTATQPPAPTATQPPAPTATQPPAPTATQPPAPTATQPPGSTDTATPPPGPTDTATPPPVTTDTATPPPTDTPGGPQPTATQPPVVYASSVTVDCPGSVTYSGSAQTPCSAFYTTYDGHGGTLSDITYINNTNVGFGVASASWPGDSTHSASQGSLTFQIVPATSTVNVSCPPSVPYTGSAQTPCTASVTGAGMGAVDVSASLEYGNNLDPGTASAFASWGGDGNHTGSSDSGSFTIGKGVSTVTVICLAGAPYTYTGSAQTPCTASASGTGMSPVDVSASLTYGNNTNAGPATASASWAGDENYNGSSATGGFTIQKASADCTVTPYTVIFDGNAHTATGACTGIGGASVSVLDLGGTTKTNAGDYPADAWTLNNSNYAASGTIHDSIGQASSTVTVTCPPSVPYTGSAQTPCTAIATGIGMSPVDVSVTLVYDNNTALGTATATASWYGDQNHSSNAGSGSFTITKGPSTVTVTCTAGAPYTYTGSAQTPCTASASGAGMNPVDVSSSLVYANNTNAGPATASASWAGDDNYNGSSATGGFTIQKADATCKVIAYAVPFDGNPHTATGSCTGIGGESVSGLDLSGTTHTNAGDYPNDAWTLNNSNYAASGTVPDSLTPVDATCTIVGYNDIYDGLAHVASGSCAGVGSIILSGLDLGATNHTVAGDYPTDPWTFTDITGNYNNASSTVHDNIAMASATCTILGYSGVYDGAAHAASGSCTSASGATLSGLTLSGSFTNVPGGSANWSFTNSNVANSPQNGSVPIVITQAPSTVKVACPASATYNGSALRPCTAVATGAGGLNQAIPLTQSNYSNNTNVGAATVSVTWAGDTDHTGSTGSGGFSIIKADPVCTIIPYNLPYDGSTHTSLGSCVGFGGITLTGLDRSGTTHTAAGDYPNDPWSFTDVAGNYNNASGSVHDRIAMANATCTIVGFTGPYDSQPHGANGSCLSASGVVLTGLNLGSTFINVGTYTATWSFSNPNVSNSPQSGSVTVTITKANQAPLTVTGPAGPITILSPGTATATGGSGTGAVTFTSTTPTACTVAGTTVTVVNSTITCQITATRAADNNYNAITSPSYTVPMAKAAQAPLTVTGPVGPITITSPGTATATGGSGTGAVTFTSTTPTACTVAGTTVTVVNSTITCQITATKAADNNYNLITSANYTVPMAKAPQTTVVTVTGPSPVTYGATGAAKASGGNGNGALIFSSGSSTGCSVAGTTVSVISVSGTCSLTATRAADNNFLVSAASVPFPVTLNKANPKCSVNGYNIPFDGFAHTATGSCGVSGEVITNGLDLSATKRTTSGNFFDPWTYTDVTGNYLNESGSVHDHIRNGSISPVCTITPYTNVPFDGNPHTATGSCLGVNGETLSGLVLTGTTHTNVGDYPNDQWTFTDPLGNYNNASGPVHDSIIMGTATCTVSPYNLPYDGSSHTATGACLSAGGVTLTGLDLSGTTHTNVGDYPSDHWTFSNANYNPASSTVHDSITQATPNCSTITAYNLPYNGSSHTASGSCTGAGGVTLTGLDLSGTTHTNVGDYPGDPWTFTDATGKYKPASGTLHDSITQSTATCTITPYNVPYDGSSHTATGMCLGTGGVTLTGLDLSGTTHTNVGDYPADPWTFTDATGNYAAASGSVHDSLTQATPKCTVTPYNVPYDGSVHTATGACTGIAGVTLTGLDLSGTTHTNVGDYPSDPWTYSDASGNYAAASGSVHDSLAQADPVCTVTPYNVTYDGSPHTATGSCTGTAGVTLTGLDLSGTTHTNVGDYPSDPWTFSDATGNYKPASGSVHDSLAKADPLCTVTPYNVPYDGNPHTATGACLGIQGETLNGLVLTGTTHTNAGDYPSDPWTYSDSTGNYKDASGTTHDSLAQATATCTVTPYNVTYDGNPHTATGSCSGIAGEDLSSGLNLSGTTHTKAGDYPTDPWTFSDATGNYNTTSGTVNDTISKADAICSVTPYTVAYDGDPHTATGSCSGIAGEDLSSGLDLSGTTHTNAGDYPTDPWTFSDATGNYKTTSGSVHDSLTQAEATCSVTPYTLTYDGDAHTASGACLGAKGETLSGLDLSGTTHSNVGDYPTDPWSFTDATGNYKTTSGSVHDSLTQADATCSVTPYSLTYDGDAHTASGACLGTKGETLTGLDLSGTTHTNVGDYPSDPWTFSDATGNYNSASGSVHDSLAKADPLCTVTPYNVPYDGNPHTATGACLGIKGETLSGLVLSGTTHTNAGDYPTDPWTFSDSTGNYKDASGSVHDSLAQADPVCTITPYNVPYDGNPHTSTGACLGIKGETLSGLVLSGTTHTNAGDYPTDPWTFTDSTGNYKDASGSVHDSLAQADPVCTVNSYNVPYDGNAHTATGACLGIQGETLGGLVLTGTTHTNAGDFPADPWTFTDSTGNYNNASGTLHDIITQATPNCTIAPYTVAYDGNPHTATGACLGTKGETLTGLDLRGTSHTAAGDYPNDPWTFTDSTGNYKDASGSGHDSINQASAICTVTPYNVTYDGNPHTAAGACLGVKGETLSGLVLTSTIHTNAGDYPTDPWSFTDATGNYKDASGTTHDSIAQADPVCTVTAYNVPYDGSSHTATGGCLGVKGETLSGLVLTGTIHTNASDYPADTWTFINANYNPAGGSVHDSLTKADPVCTITPYNIPFDGNSHTALGACLGVKGETLAGLDLSGTTHTDVGDYPTDPWAFTDVTGNYNNLSGSVHDSLTLATATCSIRGYTGNYDGQAHGAAGSCTGASGTTLDGLLLGSSFTNVGVYTVNWSFTNPDVTNSPLSGSVTITINKASSTVTVVCPSSELYTGVAWTPCAAHVSGAGGLYLALSVSYINNINLGTATASVSYLGDANHTGSLGSTTFSITTATTPTPTSAAISSVLGLPGAGALTAANHKGESGLGLDGKAAPSVLSLTIKTPASTPTPTSTKAVVNSGLGAKAQSQNNGKSQASNFWSTYSGLFGCIGSVFLAFLIFFMFKRRNSDNTEENNQENNQGNNQ